MRGEIEVAVCARLVEFTIIKCPPYYLEREFTAGVIVAVYL